MIFFIDLNWNFPYQPLRNILLPAILSQFFYNRTEPSPHKGGISTLEIHFKKREMNF